MKRAILFVGLAVALAAAILLPSPGTARALPACPNGSSLSWSTSYDPAVTVIVLGNVPVTYIVFDGPNGSGVHGDGTPMNNTVQTLARPATAAGFCKGGTPSTTIPATTSTTSSVPPSTSTSPSTSVVPTTTPPTTTAPTTSTSSPPTSPPPSSTSSTTTAPTTSVPPSSSTTSPTTTTAPTNPTSTSTAPTTVPPTSSTYCPDGQTPTQGGCVVDPPPPRELPCLPGSSPVDGKCVPNELPETGSGVWTLLAWAVGLVSVGGGAMAVRRR